MKEEIGKTYNFLTLIGRIGRKWQAVCCCGTQKLVARGALTRKVRPIKSCGCKRLALLSAANSTHGHSKKVRQSSEYSTYICWCSMHWRCENPGRDDYSRYGGRGIKVCARWKDYANFVHDMGLRPKGRSLGRIDNDGNYEPSNCRLGNSIGTSKEYCKKQAHNLLRDNEKLV